MANRLCYVFFFLVLSLAPLWSFAIQESRPLPGDPRRHVITYNAEAIHKYVGYYDYAASIVLENGETVETLVSGDPTAWLINSLGNRIFLKPIANNPTHANTNMVLITNKRVYHFILEAAFVDEELGINDPNLVLETTFVYPNTGEKSVQNFASKKGPDLSEPDKYNFNYTMSGSEEIAPLRVFDDGEFTYFQFPTINADIPAFFLVDAEGREALINYRVEGDYLVLERVTSQLTLRHGKNVTCIFNENRPMPHMKTKTNKRRAF